MIRKQDANALFQPAGAKPFGAALRAQREALGLTLDQVAAKTRISKPYLSNIETARLPGTPSPEKLEKIALALNLPPRQIVAAGDWLRTPASVRKLIRTPHTPRREDGAIDLDSLLAASPTKKTSAPSTHNPLPLARVPVINSVAAGQPAEFTDLQYPAGVADASVPAPDLPDAPLAAAFALRVSGDSMAPDYAEGEIIIVHPAEPADGEDCVIRLADDANFATTFKRVFFERDPDGEPIAVRLVPLNPKYTHRRVPLEQVTGIYPILYRLLPARRPPNPLSPPPERTVTTTRVSIEND
jgi:SOS-response transcriptional repressor LexA